ncbi:hypothetical protein D3C77_613190 [compost metagenome]
MQCNVCRYEFTLSEIQSGVECPVCAANAEQEQRAAEVAEQKAVVYVKPQEVVVVDFQMSFNSMVWFMVKLVLASIPALIILSIIFAVLIAAFSSSLLGLMGLSS